MTRRRRRTSDAIDAELGQQRVDDHDGKALALADALAGALADALVDALDAARDRIGDAR